LKASLFVLRGSFLLRVLLLLLLLLLLQGDR